MHRYIGDPDKPWSVPGLRTRAPAHLPCVGAHLRRPGRLQPRRSCEVCATPRRRAVLGCASAPLHPAAGATCPGRCVSSLPAPPLASLCCWRPVWALLSPACWPTTNASARLSRWCHEDRAAFRLRCVCVGRGRRLRCPPAWFCATSPLKLLFSPAALRPTACRFLAKNPAFSIAAAGMPSEHAHLLAVGGHCPRCALD